RLSPGEHVGVIGRNGCGKSTLFSIILGDIEIESGERIISPKLRISHMSQEVLALKCNIVDYILDGDSVLRHIEASIQEAEKHNNTSEITYWYDQLGLHDGYTAHSRAEQLLHGLGFKQQEMERLVQEFSGGWRMRLNLARALMCPSDILLLDEPTNHLDMDAICWLEGWLKQYTGTLLMIAHDRAFLDQVAESIVHIEQHVIKVYSGNYTTFEKTKAEQLHLQEAMRQKQEKQREHLQSFINRFKAKATKAKQAQSRMKALEKMEMIAPAYVNSSCQFKFQNADKISDPLLRIDSGSVSYQTEKKEITVLKSLNISIHPGQRIGLLGFNGAGKSTLIKALLGHCTLSSGTHITGEHLVIGYFAQHQVESLDQQLTPFMHIQRLSPGVREQKIFDFLGSFDFFGDKVHSPIYPFSGGEQARLALALLAWQKPNLLLLDEPTNHLDMEMRHALTMALQSFSGAAVIISHDRALLDTVVDEFWLVHEGIVAPYAGDLLMYVKALKSGTLAHDHRPLKDQDTIKKSNHARRTSSKTTSLQQKLQKELTSVEKKMKMRQDKLNELASQLNDSSLYLANHSDQLQVLLNQQSESKAVFETLEIQWLTVTEQLEKLL
ncbi:MAG: ATP-binding cassette domain-containing protein, partial [Endozoicomonadaceae bacterium]|nr:ATP-binding cassette domain-containing protein [Endozoicomonadaceae bacterium]